MKELIQIEEKTAVELFSSEEGLSSIVQEARDFVADFKPDLTTAKGRAEITSLASKVARFKGKLDDYGKDLVADWKSKSKAVDANRKNMRDELDALKVIARQPLTDWEAEQEARIAAEEAAQALIDQQIADEELAENLRKQLEQNHEMGLLLNEKYDREAADEAERVEREQREETERQEREAKAEADRIESERVAEEERQETIRLENIETDRVQAQNNKMLVFTNYKTHSLENIDVSAFEAILKEMRVMELTEEDWDKDFIGEASLAQSRAIIGIQEAIDRRKKYESDQAELQTRREEAAETQRKEEAAQQEQIIIDRDAAAALKKSENKKHRGKINQAILARFMEMGADEQTGKDIISAIAKNEVLNVTINY